MQENYAEGNLGVIFDQAVPLTLPIVAQILHEKHDESEGNDRARALIQSCRDQVDMLQEGCANEAVVREIRTRRLRLRTDGGGMTNAHLMNLTVDAEGNIVLPAAGQNNSTTGEESTGANRRERLKPFEVVSLASLVPRSAEEAVVLIPSLSRFELTDLQDVVAMLEP